MYTTGTLPILDIETDGTLFHLSPASQKIQSTFGGQKMLIPSVDGMLTIKQNGDGFVATFSATSYKRVGIIIAEFTGAFGVLSLLFRIEICSRNGLKFQKLDVKKRLRNGHFSFPEMYKMNTAVILAVRPKSMMDFRVYANQDGVIDYVNFNGMCISGFVGTQTQFEEHKVI